MYPVMFIRNHNNGVTMVLHAFDDEEVALAAVEAWHNENGTVGSRYRAVLLWKDHVEA